jgi:hypothetical protein
MAHFARSFRLIAADLQTIKESRTAKTVHTENSLTAIGQLRAG